jgi:hypothetical protein
MKHLTFADLKPETVEFLKGAGRASVWGQRSLIHGSRRRQPYMGRARIYAHATHGGYAKSAKAKGSPREQMKRMMDGYNYHAQQARAKMDLMDRIQSSAPEMMPHLDAIHQAMQRHLGSAKTYHRLTMMTHNSVKKSRGSHEWQARDAEGRWTQHAERGEHTGYLDKLKRLHFLSHDNAAGDAGSGEFFQRLVRTTADKVKKDFSCGDVHIAANIGGDSSRRKSKKYPPLSLARMPNGETK